MSTGAEREKMVIESDIERAVKLLAPAAKIMVFTGAGISAEAGIQTFRGEDGLWNNVDPRLFEISHFLSDSEVRKEHWSWVLEGLRGGPNSKIKPTKAHRALGRLYDAGRMTGCITQNIDGLHQQGGIPTDSVAELHGTVQYSLCYECQADWPTSEVLDWIEDGQLDPRCPMDDCGGVVKLATILFGEQLPYAEIDKATNFANDAQAVLAIGTTLAVFPAASFVIDSSFAGKPVVLVNLGNTDNDPVASVRISGKAGDYIPRIVDGILAGS